MRIEGRGIFSGAPCAVELQPAPAGSGVTFIKNGVRIQAHPDSFVEGAETANTSGFQADGQRVLMTEHLMAALWCAGIDTVDVHCEGPELPNADGSALLYYEALADVERMSNGPRPTIRLHEASLVQQMYKNSQQHEVKSGMSASIAISPHAKLSISYLLSHPELGESLFDTELDRHVAAREILPARTFITQAEAEQLQAAGILRNTDESSALVIRNGVPNSPLRFENEYARHKVLDLLGDLACLPFDIVGRIKAMHSGHALNRALARKLMELNR